MRGFSVFYSSLVFLDLTPIGFQNPTIWGLLFPVLDRGPGCLMPGTIPSLLEEEFCIFWIPPVCRLQWCLRWGLGKTVFLPPLSISMCLFYLLLWRCSPNSQAFFRVNYSICSSKFVVSMGGGEFRAFRYCHLELDLT